MEEDNHNQAAVGTTDRGCFDFFKKKYDGKPPQEVAMTDADDKAKEEKKGDEKHTLMEQLHHSDSHSSSGSDEEVVGEKKRKKKGLKEKIKQKISGEKQEDTDLKDASAPADKCDAEAAQLEAKKGLLEKIKEIFPGQHKKAEETPAECEASGHYPESDPKEKKGTLEKIKEKMPGSHQDEEEKKKE